MTATPSSPTYKPPDKYWLDILIDINFNGQSLLQFLLCSHYDLFTINYWNSKNWKCITPFLEAKNKNVKECLAFFFTTPLCFQPHVLRLNFYHQILSNDIHLQVVFYRVTKRYLEIFSRFSEFLPGFWKYIFFDHF